MVMVQSAPGGDVGCYDQYGWCSPQYSYCVDCGSSGGGEEPGPGPGGGSFDCMANITGPTIVMVNDHVTYNLSTDCPEPSGFNWGGGAGGNSGTTSYTTWWTSSGDYIVTVAFSSSISTWIWNEEEGVWYVDVQVISKTASLDVDVVGPGSNPTSKLYRIDVGAEPSAIGPNQSCIIFVEVWDEFGELMPFVPVSLSARGEDGSGGHAHDGSRPVGTFSSSSGTIDQWGYFETSYTSSEVCGRDIITAWAGAKAASLYLIVKVSGLAEMGISSNYNLIGMTPTHPSNHWGSPSTISNLINIANEYLEQFPGASPLAFNDMNLVYGGLFDIDGNWMPPHDEHRYGRNCDLPISNIPIANRIPLDRIIQENGGIVKKEEGSPYGPHWHLTFY